MPDLSRKRGYGKDKALKTKNLLIKLHSLLGSELSKDAEFDGSDADVEMAAIYYSVER